MLKTGFSAGSISTDEDDACIVETAEVWWILKFTFKKYFFWGYVESNRLEKQTSQLSSLLLFESVSRKSACPQTVAYRFWPHNPFLCHRPNFFETTEKN